MCHSIAKSHRTSLYIQLFFLSSAIILTSLALASNLTPWTVVASVVLMGFAVVAMLAVRGGIWVLLPKVDALRKCMYDHKAGPECKDKLEGIYALMKTLYGFLVAALVLTIAAAALSWIVVVGAIAIGIALAAQITCLVLLSILIARYNQLLQCLP